MRSWGVMEGSAHQAVGAAVVIEFRLVDVQVELVVVVSQLEDASAAALDVTAFAFEYNFVPSA